VEDGLTITTERVDDVPVLLAQLARMAVAALLDAHFPAHGHWQGLSPGQTVAVWLTYIVSEGDHRLQEVRPWVEQRRETLAAGLGEPVRALDVTDDRLASLLAALSDDRRWAAFEAALAGRLVRVYDLDTERVRVDATTASGYWQVTPDGLFQFGHSKDHRPDLPQVKVLLATLDPFAVPLVTDVVSGEHADDPLYLPAIARVRAGVGRTGLLYVGDSKMAALDTRASIAAAHDYYLCPLPATQVPVADLDAWLEPVVGGTQPLTAVERPGDDGRAVRVAEGYEWTAPLTATVEGQPVTWTERRLLVRSLAHAQAAETALRARLAKAQAALAPFTTPPTRRRGRDDQERRAAAQAIVTRYRLEGVLQLTWTDAVSAPAVQVLPAWDGRPAMVEPPPDRHARPLPVLHVTVNEQALATALRRLGWRVYVTNQAATVLPLERAVLAYRDEYLVERSLGRLKGRPLSLSPLYLTRDDHATGLIRLLSLALRVLTLLEGVVRRQLADPATPPLTGYYPGQPTRATRRPTAERLLAAFDGLTLTLLHTPTVVLRHLTPLSSLQQRLLILLGCPPDTYTRLTAPTCHPP
jgi:transposase